MFSGRAVVDGSARSRSRQKAQPPFKTETPDQTGILDLRAHSLLFFALESCFPTAR
jgi:hypothetical protein